MAHGDTTQADVRKLYVFDGLSLRDIAERTGISYATVRRWRKNALEKGDDWDKVREAHVIAGGKIDDVAKGLLTRFIIHFSTTLEDIEQSDLPAEEKAKLLSSLGDSFTKMTAASKKLVPEISALATAMRTVTLLGDFIQTEKPELLSEFLNVLEPFGQVVEREFK